MWTVVSVNDRDLERLGGCAGPDKTKALVGLSVAFRNPERISTRLRPVVNKSTR